MPALSATRLAIVHGQRYIVDMYTMPFQLSRRYLFALVAGLLLLGSPLRAQDAFLSGIEDMPMMPGLYEVLDTTLVFDSSEGRYVEAYASGDVTPLAVAEFYRNSLPQLGWQLDGNNTFRREGEELVILATEALDGLTSVRFALSPEGAAGAEN